MDLLTVFERVAAHKRREISFLNHEATRTDNPARLQEINGQVNERFRALDELSQRIKTLSLISKK